MLSLRKVLAVAAASAVAVVGSIAVTGQASAAAGCRVDYTVTNQWQGGFGADVRVTNLGDPITGWDVRFSFGAGQRVSQLWNGSVTQSGAEVSVRNAGWNGALGTNGTTSFGFNGAFTGTNPAPSAFTLNGVACTGAVTPSGSPTTSPSATPSQSPRPTTTPTSGPVTGSAAQLVADLGKGWNLGNQLEANINGMPSETAWGNPVVTSALIDRVKAAGFRTIRIPVSYLGKIGSAPSYTVDAAWLSRIQEVVDLAYDRGLHVIINMHGDGYKSVAGSWLICDASGQDTIKDKYQKVWQQVASRFSGYGGRLILESMNENFDGQYGAPTQPCYSNINAYNQVFVDTVRRTGGNNTSRWLLVPGWNTNIDYTTGSYGFVVPTDQYRSSAIPSSERRLMISAHFYDPWDFTGTESGAITQWGPNATDAARKSTWGQQDFMDAQLKKMHDTFTVNGYPVFIGEYGSIDKTSSDPSNNRYRADYARTLVATAKKYGAATAYWDNGHNGQYGFALFDRSSATVTQQGIIDAIMGS
ncbi:cellulase family glycosylhydrolase [Cellulomonas fengjieae]|uniref:Endoglucanase n=1 Tax=Cellulomonas fengjieae TaxID=2819978 RepID=A0ABS3SKQ7_9CELL|nr:cellulase family glycosylhydrolase [Cellulomonas fengjieae]MBO3086320.1 cellulase family glycosylhydrolase [Cellulomonas fengjieae]QVI65641.1 cellulase family glycosylhydrolase [Cellulomonas fengjieae]